MYKNNSSKIKICLIVLKTFFVTLVSRLQGYGCLYQRVVHDAIDRHVSSLPAAANAVDCCFAQCAGCMHSSDYRTCTQGQRKAAAIQSCRFLAFALYFAHKLPWIISSRIMYRSTRNYIPVNSSPLSARSSHFAKENKCLWEECQ